MVNNIHIIIEKLTFSNTLAKRLHTKRIVLHHAAGRGSVEDIHKSHLNNGWSGIGYHFYIRRDGNIYQGRPLDTIGAHCLNNNSDSIGICFEGNMQKENLTEEQLKNGKMLVQWLLYKYKLKAKKNVFGHRDLMATACPGKNFPLADFKKLKKCKANVTYSNKKVHTNKTTSTSYYVTVSVKENSVLNVRSSPGTTGKIIKMLKNKERVLIVEEKTIGFTKWGKIKNGGWICLTYTKRG